MHSGEVRLPSVDITDMFLFEQKRRVQADRTVSLDNVAYEVDAVLVGETIVLRYDPARPREQRAVQVWHRGKQIQIARRVDAYANCFVRRDHTTKALHPSEPMDEPPPGMRLSDFDFGKDRRGGSGDDDEGIF